MSIPTINSYALPDASSFPANKTFWQVEPSRAVLLIHDMQRYFLSFYDPADDLLKKLVCNLQALRAWANAHGVPVVYTAQPHEQSLEDRALLNNMWGPGLTTSSPAQQEIISELAPSEDDVVLTKWRYSAFQRTNLQQSMKEWKRDQLIIGGVYAHIGCMVTAIDAFMNDIQPFMVGDALGDFSEENHRMALQYVATRCGCVIETSNLTEKAGL